MFRKRKPPPPLHGSDEDDARIGDDMPSALSILAELEISLITDHDIPLNERAVKLRATYFESRKNLQSLVDVWEPENREMAASAKKILSSSH